MTEPRLIASRKRSFKVRCFYKIALLLAGLLFAFLVAEIFLRFTSLVRNVGPSFSVYDSEYGKRLKTNFSCVRKSPEFTMSFSTNSLGHRGPEPEGATTQGIVFIGDSFTMGYGVSDGEEYCRLVRERLLAETHQRLPMVNMGIGSNGNGRWIKSLRGEVDRYDPKLVVFQVCGNDYGDNANERLFRYTDTDGLVEQQVPEVSRLRKVNSLLEGIPGLASSYLFCFVKQVVMDWRMKGNDQAEEATEEIPKSASEDDKLTSALIDESLKITAAHGWPAVIISVHNDPQRDSELAALCKKHGLELILIPNWHVRPDLYYHTDAHWNAKGHRYVAEIVTKAIQAKLTL